MADDPRIEELLSRWEALHDQGKELSPEELCGDCPELAAELAGRVRALRSVNRLLESTLIGPAPRAPSVRDVTPGQFVHALIASKLMTADQVADFLDSLPADFPAGDAAALGQELIRRDKLTAFQVSQLLEGRSRGLVFGEYTVLDRLGGGGMGEVLKARHRRLKRMVALKVIRSGLTGSPLMVERFHREMEAVARLDHPNIARAYDASEQDGVHYLVMEYVEGRDLAQAVHAQGPLAADRAVDYLVQAARGLEHAHQRGIVHRDVKPSNLLLSREGVVKVLDLGLAKCFDQTEGPSPAGPLQPSPEGPYPGDRRITLTDPSAVFGTVDYMAPEQAASARQADHRADIYSLGCTLYFLLTGQPVPKGDDLAARLLWHRDSPVPSLREVLPAVPAALDAIFQRMLARQPENRYPGMGEVITALEAWQKQVGVAGQKELLPDDKPGRLRRPRSVLLAVFAGVVAVAAAIGWAVKAFFPPGEVSSIGKSEQIEKGTTQRGKDARAAPRPFITNSLEMKLVLLEPGTFLMGSPDSDPNARTEDYCDEKPQHRVQITKAFYLSAYEVTQDQYAQIMGANPSYFSPTGKGRESVAGLETARFPVERVTWGEADEFCQKLSRKEGKKYRLPTEAEWEYACRAGTTEVYSFGNDPAKLDEFAWFGGNSGGVPHRVGEKAPNRWGLYDMHGNVREWCLDGFGKYTPENKIDPLRFSRKARNVVRGGCYYFGGRDARSASRFDIEEGVADNIGFRVAMDP